MTEVLRGVGVNSGRRAAPVVRMAPPVTPPDAEGPLAADERESAVEAIALAGQQVRDDLLAAAAAASGTAAEVLAVTAAMAADPSLLAGAQGLVRADGLAPASAVWRTADALAEQLATLGGNMAERATDVRDVRDRIVAHLTGAPMPGVPRRDLPFVLVADDLAPADTATLDPARVVAIVTSGGGPTSHTSILARSLGIACVVAVEGAQGLRDGQVVLVDGGAGTVHVDPDRQLVDRASKARAVPMKLSGPGATHDGHAVALLANIGRPDDVPAVVAAGAEGVGLFRTEFCFLGRSDAPTVDEQVEQYAAVLSAFPGRKVVIRTLDAGADKPLPFVTADDEPNPALGVRGLRTSWASPGVLQAQLEAISTAARDASAEVHVMAPMVATIGETREFVEACAQHGLDRAGIMIEVPAAALRARDLLEVATFASVGTNDLTQYAMAADRELASLAALSTPWQPAVLDLLALAGEGARRHGRPLGVCGEAAADPALAPVLVGLGVTSLSMAPRALGAVGAVLATLTLAQCQELARVAREADCAEDARVAVRSAIPAIDHWGL
ncbi:phosphoenolpyruvate--protein phosphotransferase [Demequina sp.]|uniref:phosphoenolpyruvate--protein phosphotransferase n=1 Tax=Demequina sp. TaxID=2050685 RepID=UPI003A8AB593